jgi:PKD repeat protein
MRLAVLGGGAFAASSVLMWVLGAYRAQLARPSVATSLRRAGFVPSSQPLAQPSNQTPPMTPPMQRVDGPVARFAASTPVAVGQRVTYIDESYDSTPGATIVKWIWTGRQSRFERPGTYTVTLRVVDSRGRLSQPYSQKIIVMQPSREQAGTPVAYFTATSPVLVGQQVNYVDESYNPTPYATIVAESWTGRQVSFSAAGTYPVTLRVMNSAGVWSAPYTQNVVVLPVGSIGGTRIRWTLQVNPNPASRGAVVTVLARASGAGQPPPYLEVDPRLQETWGSVSYSATNASGPMRPLGDGASFVRTLTVPAASTFPVGNYFLVLFAQGSPSVATWLTVQAPPSSATYQEPIVSGQ